MGPDPRRPPPPLPPLLLLPPLLPTRMTRPLLVCTTSSCNETPPPEPCDDARTCTYVIQWSDEKGPVGVPSPHAVMPTWPAPLVPCAGIM
jgi:hypothetical protein